MFQSYTYFYIWKNPVLVPEKLYENFKKILEVQLEEYLIKMSIVDVLRRLERQKRLSLYSIL